MKTIEKTKFTKELDEVYSEIVKISLKHDDSLETITKNFYKIMKKHGICQGTWTPNGRLTSNPSWVICINLFTNLIYKELELMLLLQIPPKTLLAYGKQPKNK